MKMVRSLVGAMALGIGLSGCGGGGGTSQGATSGPLAYSATVLNAPVVPATYTGAGEVCGADESTAIYEFAPGFAEVDLPSYSTLSSNVNGAYGIGSNGSFAGYVYSEDQGQYLPIYWSSATSQPVALPLPSGSPSMIASIAGTTIYGFTTGSYAGRRPGIYRWATPSSQPILFSNSFPTSSSINTILPYRGGYVVTIGAINPGQAEAFVFPASGAAPTELTDNLGSTNANATSVGPDGTIYGLSSAEKPIYWPTGTTSSPKLLPTYTDPSFSGTLNAEAVYVNAKNEIVATYIGSDVKFRSCLWATRSSQPIDLSKQPFGIAATSPGPSIGVLALFDDGSMVARTNTTNTNTYYYLTPKS